MNKADDGILHICSARIDVAAVRFLVGKKIESVYFEGGMPRIVFDDRSTLIFNTIPTRGMDGGIYQTNTATLIKPDGTKCLAWND